MINILIIMPHYWGANIEVFDMTGWLHFCYYLAHQDFVYISYTRIWLSVLQDAWTLNPSLLPSLQVLTTLNKNETDDQQVCAHQSTKQSSTRDQSQIVTRSTNLCTTECSFTDSSTCTIWLCICKQHICTRITALNYYHATQVTEFLRYQSVCILFIKRLLGFSYICEYRIYLPLSVR